MDWNDLKYLLAVAASGGLAGAARTLRVDPSTVSRRISALEKALAVEIVIRNPDGLTLSPTGQRILAVARSIESQLEEMTAELAMKDEPTGILRITSTDSFSALILRAFASTRERYPGLVIELTPSTATLDLRRREADIAVRMFRDEHEGLAMRRLVTLGWSLFASEAYLATIQRGPRLLDGHRLIGYSEDRKAMPGARWIAEQAHPSAITMRVDSTRAAFEAAVANIGACVVPCHMVQDKLVRLTDQVLATNDVYAVFLPERRTDPKIRVGVDTLVELFDTERAMFSGASAT